MKIVEEGNKTIVKSPKNNDAGPSWAKLDEPLLTIEDTGNGYNVVSHEWRSSWNDHWFNLDYYEAEYLYKALKHLRKKEKERLNGTNSNKE